MVLKATDSSLRIVDYKDLPLEFYLNSNSDPTIAEKYTEDIIKQLTYELALQQEYTVESNIFFIPYYYESVSNTKLGEYEPQVNIKGIKIYKANFFVIQETYLKPTL
ncbi:hypothetical protein [Coleofasciculus sp. FACHB-SPT36]|uniref:hypothetical protein n=1 Tax=Cyanophyceae TaxID=3028117 RepID=UPI00168BF8AC|nr:hypothetical protein [Coleofasciculus sp. FACHB-SPT36]MBD2541045.1 hypothetical protein [Coleofasciculus sp. FACHB-SPT36]